MYRQQVADLQAALTGQNAAKAMERTRDLIERVMLNLAPNGYRRFEIELKGGISEMKPAAAAGGVGLSEQIKMVAGIGFEPMTFRL